MEVDECSMYICNPATRECIELPKFNPPQCSKQKFSSEFHSGFGLDTVSKDFKVVLILYLNNWPDVRTEVQVYTLSSNSWRTIGEAPVTSMFYFYSAYVDGSLHWLARDFARRDSLGKLVVSLNLGSEEFRVFRTPELFYRADNVQLIAMGGCLSIVDPFFDDHIEIWLMKEYGVEESWTKFSVSKVCLEGLTPKAISFEKNSEFKLLANSSELVSYNIDTGNFTSLEVDGVSELPEGCPKFFGAFSFVERLISLKSACQIEEQP
ncbi:hypothetical protein AQUCO_04700033v1 [Aquilegia coerulea]|uniref:F-box associated beta-propeller type 3 domain-containing protein n=1 Tax=Aquilegia coerulea TaxID=218851 RepID=A0A2G5CKT4_AQUCA|nr:hypothetical protein AQUCO_04700033v1 [Aquilegia coerulea]